MSTTDESVQELERELAREDRRQWLTRKVKKKGTPSEIELLCVQCGKMWVRKEDQLKCPECKR